MFSQHRIGCAVDTQYFPVLVSGAVAALVFFEMPLVVDTELNRGKYERYI